jgi:hypothetical protein
MHGYTFTALSHLLDFFSDPSGSTARNAGATIALIFIVFLFFRSAGASIDLFQQKKQYI